MPIRSLAAALLVAAIFLVPVANAQTMAAMSMPYVTSGDSPAAWVSGYVDRNGVTGYPLARFVTRNGQQCFSLRFANTTDPAANTGDWSCSAPSLGFTPENAANKGVANGYAPLDSTGKVPSVNLPTSTGGSGSIYKTTVDTALGYSPLPLSSIGSLALESTAYNNAQTNKATFTDGSGATYYRAAPGYPWAFISDFSLTVLGAPEMFSATDIKSFLDEFYAKRSTSAVSTQIPVGSIPIFLNQDGSYVTDTGTSPSYPATRSFCDGFDAHCTHPTAEGIFSFVHLEQAYYQKTGDLSEFTTHASAIDTALSAIPLDSSTQIPYISPSDQWSVYGFQESIRFEGLNAVGAMQLWKTATEAAQLYGLIGNSTLQNKYLTLANTIAANLGTSSALWDSNDGMFLGATIQDNQIDTTASVLFVQYQIPSPNAAAQRNAISSYLVNNASTLFYQGYMRQSNTQFAVVAQLDHDQSYSTADARTAPGCYQGGGFWSHHNRAVVEALALTSTSAAQAYMQAFEANPDPTMEYYGPNCTSSAGTHGFTQNLESPVGITYASHEFPALAYRPLGSTGSGGLWTAESNPNAGTAILVGSNAAETGDVQNTNPAGYASFNLYDNNGNPAGLMGYGNPSAAQPTLQSTVFLGGNNHPICFFVTIGTCAVTVSANGAVSFGTLSSSKAGEVADVINSNVAGYSSFNYENNSGNAGALGGYGNASVSQAILQGKAFFGGNGVPLCLFSTIGRCDISIATDGSVTIANLVGGNTAAPTTYGTPTIQADNGSGAALTPNSTSSVVNWVNNDHLFAVVATPTSNIPAGTTLFSAYFGKAWYDANSYATHPNCHADPMIQYAPIYRPLTTDGSNVTTWVTSVALTSGTTYAWSIECGADHEQ